MSSSADRTPDPLRPTAAAAAAAWSARVLAGRAQIEQLREIHEPADFYEPMAARFGQDPRRTGDAALDVLCSMAGSGETWLDIGAGGGRYALPLALRVERVVAVDPSPAMLRVLRRGMERHGIEGIDVVEGDWPLHDRTVEADVALMAHVGYDIEHFAAFLDAAEASAHRCVVIMRTGVGARASHLLWPEVHGVARIPYPMLAELLVLLVARGVTPEVAIVERGTWGYRDRDQLLAAMRRMLWLRPGSKKDGLLRRLLDERASERDGAWELDWSSMQDGIVSWTIQG